MRKLATIRTIVNVEPIPNADAIEKVKVDGWYCVAKKGEFKTGDTALYLEIDSLLPLIPQFEFLARGTKPKKSIADGKEIEGYRLKTIKLRGQVSQGIALPINLFEELKDAKVGDDVTELLNVHKYEPPIPASLAGEVRGSFPGFIPKTDEERIQNIENLEELQGKKFYRTEKLDGSSCTIYKYEEDFGVCSRNLNLKENEKNTFWRMARQYDLVNKLPEGYSIQGEVVGEGINGNKLKLKGQDMYIFYVFNIKEYRYLELDEMKEFASKLDMKMVPVIDDNFILNHSSDDLLKLVQVKSTLNPNVLQEGEVFRLFESNPKFSFKAISNKFLLEHGE